MKKLLFLILLVLSTGRVYATLIDSLHVTPSIDEQTFKNGRLDISFWNHGNSMVTYCLMDADGEVVSPMTVPVPWSMEKWWPKASL